MTAGPLALPVDRVVDQQSALFRTDAGTKREVANRGARVGFEVNGTDVATRTGWSVPVRGEAAEVGGATGEGNRPGATVASTVSGAGLAPGAGSGLHHLDHPHRVGLQPAPERSALTWRQFLRTQANSVLAEHTDDYNGHRPHRALGHADRSGPPNH